MYHGIVAEPPQIPCWHVTDRAEFARQMVYLQANCSVLPLQEALERMEAGTLPDRAVTLTFDDGTRNLSECAVPVLRELGMPAAVFLTTGPMDTGDVLWPDRLWQAFAGTDAMVVDLRALGMGPAVLGTADSRAATYQCVVTRCKELPDGDRIRMVDGLITALGGSGNPAEGPFAMLSWAEAHAMTRAADVTLHPHSVTHPILSRCADAKVLQEIVQSCAAVGRQTGSAPEIFAYPNGRFHDFDGRAKEVLRDCGIRWALASTHGFADRDCDPLALPRLAIGGDMSLARFRLLVSGALDGAEGYVPRRQHRIVSTSDSGAGRAPCAAERPR